MSAKATAIIPLEFTLTDGMFLRERLASADTEDGVHVELFISAAGGRIGARVIKDGKSVSYVLSPDTLGNAIYEHWKAAEVKP